MLMSEGPLLQTVDSSPQIIYPSSDSETSMASAHTCAMKKKLRSIISVAPSDTTVSHWPPVPRQSWKAPSSRDTELRAGAAMADGSVQPHRDGSPFRPFRYAASRKRIRSRGVCSTWILGGHKIEATCGLTSVAASARPPCSGLLSMTRTIFSLAQMPTCWGSLMPGEPQASGS